jgi:hypothetical protein
MSTLLHRIPGGWICRCQQRGPDGRVVAVREHPPEDRQCPVCGTPREIGITAEILVRSTRTAPPS